MTQAAFDWFDELDEDPTPLLGGTLDDKIEDAQRILREAVTAHLDGHELVGRVVLFSGGNDSTTLTHLLRFTLPEELRATAAGHANTTIGVERTRQFVRDTCAAWGLPLIEKYPPKTFTELVRESGCPGPAQHFKAYQRLKERPLRLIRKQLVTNGRRQRVMFIAGRRRAESARRTSIVEHEREGSVIWASPLANWTKADLDEYRTLHDVPRNPIADELGMSGECLCGAFAEPGEYERIAAVDPEAAEQIVAAEHAAREAGIDEQRCRWGWGAYRDDPEAQPSKVGRLCSSCDARFDRPLVERLPDDPGLDAVIARVRAKRAARDDVVHVPGQLTFGEGEAS